MEKPEICAYSGLPIPAAYTPAKRKNNFSLTAENEDRIIEMAWEDRTPFDAIERQFGLKEDEVKKLMKKKLKAGSYQRWRQRVENCSTKHEKKRNPQIDRFKCDRQRSISGNKVSKRL